MTPISKTGCSIPCTFRALLRRVSCDPISQTPGPGAPETCAGPQLKRATTYPADYVDTFVTRFPDVQVRAGCLSLAEHVEISVIGSRALGGPCVDI